MDRTGTIAVEAVASHPRAVAVDTGDTISIVDTEGTKFDLVDFVIEFEEGCLEEDDVVEGFQKLIDSGMVWRLQGFYGRTAASLIKAGLCTAPGGQG